MEMAITTERTKIPTLKLVLWIGLASIVMLFAGLTSAYLVREAEGNWIQFVLPKAFYVSTALIILSSITIQMAISAIKKNKLQAVKTYLIITLALGIGFVFAQFFGWSSLVDQKVYFVGNPSGSFVYALTGLHLAHLIGGILALTIASGKSILEKYSANNYLGISLCSIYWHFLDGLWIYLFVFLALNH